ncbi:flagellar basal body-associated FliL family protein [Allopusillimonas ginsengisoli]|uniref:flagellar basal body-associated FliL family protein n=1 Tax=Allopusillimonas ginsengisoli TaxID=453575 RepID=UPI001FD6F6A9|nr:flagellar basal body-associated FliL family protein [Allopusillimonas ginsengisoli]
MLIAFIAVASSGATLAFQKYAGLSPANAELSTRGGYAPAAPAPDPIFVPLDPFTVTLPGDYKNRVLYAAITLRVGDQQSASIINAYMPEVRDRALRLLAQQNVHDVQTSEGRAALVDILRSELAQPYTPEPEGPNIGDVLFTAFVVQ